jgi:hypothetical protein
MLRVVTDKVFVSRLYLDATTREHRVHCPFHEGDNPQGTLDIDLDKAVFYCQSSACSDPRGGGPIMFIQKWALAKEGKTLSRDEARRQMVTQSGPIMSAQEFRSDMHKRDALLFAQTMRYVYADYTRHVEGLIAEYEARIRKPTENDWKILEALYKLRSDYEWRWSVCQGVRSLTPPDNRPYEKQLVAQLFTIHKDALARGNWSMKATYAALLEKKIPSRVPMTPKLAKLLATKREPPCPEPPSRPTSPKVKRTPVPRTPVPRTPVPRTPVP